MAKPEATRIVRSSDAKLFKLVLGMVRDKLRWMETNFQGTKRRRKRRKGQKKNRAVKKAPE